ncbi:RidA family protein [Microbacterium azadirachtae]|uniref:Endoribonuclease L-PSP n=1 Tax=Microbacterium azadirachtae TaxID=582680 RepID=A0A0F0LMT8_9MICO|nr:RidA family protein [Microbacterium azadirachtae]KJL34542.1 Endoribonuclease L-PSP [Microbacterium azadirachtae]
MIRTARPFVEAINPPSLAPPAGHFDRAVRIGPWLTVSGTSALTNLTGPVEERSLPADFRAQAELTFDNIAAVLAAVDAGFEHVYEIHATLARAEDFGTLNDIFRVRIPERGFVGSGYVAEFLGPGMLLEIEVRAYLPDFADGSTPRGPGAPIHPTDPIPAIDPTDPNGDHA